MTVSYLFILRVTIYSTIDQPEALILYNLDNYPFMKLKLAYGINEKSSLKYDAYWYWVKQQHALLLLIVCAIWI